MSDTTPSGAKPGISVFERFLSLWVLACMAAGMAIGHFVPQVPRFLGNWEVAGISIPIAVLIWLMIYPMMLKVDFHSLVHAGRSPKGLLVTWTANWLIKPFSMFAIGGFFFLVVFRALIPAELARDYLAGAVLLGAAPCTAMVFVWSHLVKGNPAYTVVQVASNDLIVLVAFAPIVALLLGVGGVPVPWDTLLVSVGLFVVIPLGAGIASRYFLVRRKGADWFHNRFLPGFNGVTIMGLLLTLVIIFSFQGRVILENPLHIALIAVPLVIQTILIFALSYGACRVLRLPHRIAAPAGMVSASNFFELAVAVAIALFGTGSPVALATIVGVLVEVPVMLGLVWFANRTRKYFPGES